MSLDRLIDVAIPNNTDVRTLELMHQRLQTVWRAMVSGKGPILLQVNARSHVHKSLDKKLLLSRTKDLPHSHSPELSLTDYPFFHILDQVYKPHKLKRKF